MMVAEESVHIKVPPEAEVLLLHYSLTEGLEDVKHRADDDLW